MKSATARQTAMRDAFNVLYGGPSMSIRKIRDLPRFRPCRHPEHHPPTMIVLPPGVYEHTCPSCGKKVEFVVPESPTLNAGA